mmetsp:Transcript_25889/g.60542  ORF Transcript_25889/g.60542 Transcript_25889/m.60542 type:complete len:319 (-) Transcript_25889:3842-4798(-)
MPVPPPRPRLPPLSPSASPPLPSCAFALISASPALISASASASKSISCLFWPPSKDLPSFTVPLVTGSPPTLLPSSKALPSPGGARYSWAAMSLTRPNTPLSPVMALTFHVTDQCLPMSRPPPPPLPCPSSSVQLATAVIFDGFGRSWLPLHSIASILRLIDDGDGGTFSISPSESRSLPAHPTPPASPPPLPAPLPPTLPAPLPLPLPSSPPPFSSAPPFSCNILRAGVVAADGVRSSGDAADTDLSSCINARPRSSEGGGCRTGPHLMQQAWPIARSSAPTARVASSPSARKVSKVQTPPTTPLDLLMPPNVAIST